MAAKAQRDEARWAMLRRSRAEQGSDDALGRRYDGLTPIETTLTQDEIDELDRRLGPPAPV